MVQNPRLRHVWGCPKTRVSPPRGWCWSPWLLCYLFFFLVLQMGHMSLVRKSSFFGYARNGVIFFSLKNAEPFFSQKRRLEVSRSFFLNASILVKSTTLADIFTNLSTKLVRNWFGYHHEEVKIVKVKVCQSMIWNDRNGISKRIARQLLAN